MFDIGVIGRTVWDDWQYENAILRSANLDNFGGPGANTAVTLANLGLSTTFASVFGFDDNSKAYLGYLADKVDLKYSAKDSIPLPILRITPHKNFYWVNNNQGFFEKEQISVQEMSKSCNSLFFVEPNFTLDGLILPEKIYWSPQLTLFINKEIAKILCGIKWRAIFLNKKEKMQIESLTGNSIFNLSRKYKSTLWIVTNGPKPTMVYSKGNNFAFPVKKTNGNFPVGCGDAFAAGYCAADLLGWELDKAIKFGHKLANRVLNHVGCQISRIDAKNIFESFSYECR